VSKKDAKIQALLLFDPASRFDPHYLGFFRCFNDGLYYEAHDVLEALWLPSRKGPLDTCYKGLIQLAGAFVHLQKGRHRPADALFGLAYKNLAGFPSTTEALNLNSVLIEIANWRQVLSETRFLRNPLLDGLRPAPRLQLESQTITQNF